MAVYIGENTLKPLSPVNTMSSTSNVQNLLTNVFRPTFVYDTTNGVYQSKLELTNIDTISANTISTYAASVGDGNSNVYVGVSAGNAHSVMTVQNNYYDTFLGISAGGSTSNVRNSVFLGYRAGNAATSSSNSISIGANTPAGGNSNIYIGYGTGIVSGSNNIFLGSGMTNSGSSTSNTLLIGNSNSATIIGDLSTNRVGINLSSLPATTPSLALDVGGYTRVTNGLGINKLPGYYSLDVNGNMQVSDGYGVLTFTHDVNGNSTTTISNTSSYPNSNATLQVTGGFFSLNGTTSPIPLKKGMFMISAYSNGSNQGYIGIALSSSAQTLVSSNTGSIITSNSSSITVPTNTTWTITYFPSP
jgi:hypothetical protein